MCSDIKKYKECSEICQRILVGFGMHVESTHCMCHCHCMNSCMWNGSIMLPIFMGKRGMGMVEAGYLELYFLLSCEVLEHGMKMVERV